MSIPFGSSNPPSFLLLLHLHFGHRLPDIPPAVWLCGFICHLFFSRLAVHLFLSVIACRMCVCVCMHVVYPRVCVSVLQLTLSSQSTDSQLLLLQRIQLPLLLLLLRFCSPPTERMICVILLEQMIPYVCLCICAFFILSLSTGCSVLYCRSVSQG